VDARFVLVAIGSILAIAWVPLRYGYLRRHGRPYVLPGVPALAYAGGVLFFGGGGAGLLYIGLTRPLGIATGFWLLCAPFAIVLGLIAVATWLLATRTRS
jgi:hypothetical protein